MNKRDLNISPVYFFYGPESYLIKEEIQRILDQTLPSKDRKLNLHIFSIGEHDVKEIVRTAMTVPMFARYRVIVINEVNSASDEEMDILINYFKNPSPSTCMILNGKELGKWRLRKNEIQNFVSLKGYERLKGRALISWIIKMMREKGKTISEEIAQYIVEMVGDNLQEIENTLEKISISSGNKKRIDPSDVEAVISSFKRGTIFDLMDAIGRKDLDRAFKILQNALESKSISFKKEEGLKRFDEPAHIILGMIARHFWNLYEMKKISQNIKDIESLGDDLERPSWALKKLLEQEKNFSESTLLDGILNCYRTDLAIKRGRIEKEILMEKLLIDLCNPFSDKGRN